MNNILKLKYYSKKVMGKLKTLFSKVSNSIKETFKRFPITMIIVYITTLLVVFGTDDFVENFMDNMWFYAMGIWAIGTLFTETFFKKDFAKIIGGVVSLVIALGCRWVINDEIYSNKLILIKLIITYMSVLPLITLYKIVKDSGVSLKEYALRVLSNVGRTTTMYILANIGIFIVIFVFVELILDGNDYDILSRTLILLLGGFYVPAMLNSITDVKNEAGKFIKVLLTYILMPVAVFLIGTLYLYVIKIMLSGELLNKSLFFILSLTFTLAIPCAILLKNYDENKSVLVMSNIIFYSFIPLMILQIIAMNVRVGDYGLTESRYMGYLLIAFEIIFIILMIVKKSKHLDKVILVLAGFVILGVLSPLNIYDVPVYSQTARITKMLKTVDSFDALSTRQKNECKKAFVYVNNSFKPEYLDKKLTKEEKEAIQNYVVVYEDENGIELRDYEYDYISMYDTKSVIDVEGFKKLYPTYDTTYGTKYDINLEKYPIQDKNGDIKVTVDIQDFVKQMSEADKQNTKESTFAKVRYLKTSDENVMFYVTDFSMSYELYSNKIDHMSIDGYLLVK